MSARRANSQAREPLKINLETHEALIRGGKPRDTLFLIHGFPDSPRMWDALVAQLTVEGYRCLVPALPASLGEALPTVYSPEQVTAALHEALMRHTTDAVTLIVHDWGSLFGFMMATKNPHWVKRIITFDIGGHVSLTSNGVGTAVAFLSYQVFFALCYCMGQPMGGPLARVGLRMFRYKLRPLEEITSDTCFYYASFIVQKMKDVLHTRRIPPLTDYTPTVPVCFAYASRKPFFFHSAEWLRRMRASPPGSEVVAFPCSHWITGDKPKEAATLVIGWLARTEAVAAELSAAASKG